MKIVLVNPPLKPGLGTFAGMGLVIPPLGLAYIAAVLERADYSVTILDAPAQGLTLSGIRETIARLSPDIVGITATTPTYMDAVTVSSAVKEDCPRAIVIMGGPHVSFTPEQTLRQSPTIDIVCMGEGEQTFLELAQALESDDELATVQGIAYKDGFLVKRNPPRPQLRI